MRDAWSIPTGLWGNARGVEVAHGVLTFLKTRKEKVATNWLLELLWRLRQLSGRRLRQGLVPSEKSIVGGECRMLSKMSEDFRIQGK